MPVRQIHPVDMQCLLAICLAIIVLAPFASACTSRAISRPEPTEPTVTTPRPNITFPIFNCPPTYAAWYCLNDATCFTVEIQNEILYNCECASGFMGPRCEYKEIDGSYLPTRHRAMLETASIASGATLAVLVLVICIMMYLRREKHKSKENESEEMAHENEGIDVVDGMTQAPNMRPFGQHMRPFGPHHYRILPLESAFKR